MADIDFRYDETPPCLTIRVKTGKDAETITSLSEFRDAFELLVTHTNINTPLDDIKDVVRAVLDDQPV